MNKKLLLSLLSLGMLCAFAQGPITPQRFERGAFHQAISPHKIITKEVKNENGVENKRTNKAKEEQPSYNVDFVLDFNTEKQSAGSFTIINQNTEFSSMRLGLWDLVCGSNVASIPAGTYDMIFHFTQLDTLDADCVNLTVIRENVTIDQDMQLYISANEAKNHIHFETLTPTGETLQIGTYTLDENWQMVLMEPGNIDDCLFQNRITCSDYGIVYYIKGNPGVKMVSDYYNSKGMLATFDFFVNDVSDRYSFYSYCTAFKEHEVFSTAFEAVGADGDVTFTNDPTKYIEYEMPFKAPYHQGEELCPIIWPIAQQKYEDFYSTIGSVLDPIVEGESIKCYLDAKVEDSPMGCFMPSLELSICKETSNQWGDIDYVPVISSMPLTIANGNIRLANNGTDSYIFKVPNEPMLRYDYDEKTENIIMYPHWPTHPAFSYTIDKAKGVIGNNCPILVSDPYQYQLGTRSNLVFLFDYLGRYGETSEGQTEAQVSIKLNREEFTTSQGWFMFEGMDELMSGEVDAMITNTLIDVDNLAGSNKAQLHYTAGAEDENPPTITMLHFKDSNDNMTDRFATGDEGMMEFTAGDFNFVGRSGVAIHHRYAPESVEVSYSPYGEDNWNELPVEEVPENYWPVMGWFYTAPLASVTGEAYLGWFDLKIRLTDAAGNWQEQVLSPAFRIDNLAYSGIATPRGDNAREVARYNLAGQRVDSNATGVVIVKMSDGTARKIIQ